MVLQPDQLGVHLPWRASGVAFFVAVPFRLLLFPGRDKQQMRHLPAPMHLHFGHLNYTFQNVGITHLVNTTPKLHAVTLVQQDCILTGPVLLQPNEPRHGAPAITMRRGYGVYFYVRSLAHVVVALSYSNTSNTINILIEVYPEFKNI